MDIANTLSGTSLVDLERQVDTFNAKQSYTRSVRDNLQRDDFLKILITQLQHQDPTKPMEDREFIAQMAQFSSLEQMTNMSRQFEELSATMKNAQAVNLVGRSVEINHGKSTVHGIVEAVNGNTFPQLLVDGVYYNYDDVVKVMK